MSETAIDQKKTVAIIGAGIAGLSLGCYLQMNGYHTEIFEAHNVPGGLCTSWKRGDYTIDLCIHWLIGSKPGAMGNRSWSELIDLGQFEMHNPEEYLRVVGDNGRVLHVYSDLDRLHKELLEKAPEDADAIERFIGDAKRFADFPDFPETPRGLQTLWQKLQTGVQILPFIPQFSRYFPKTVEELAEEFRSPLVKRMVHHLFLPELGALFAMMTAGWRHAGNAGYPIGGSMRFAMKLFHRYRKLGGRVHFNSRVSKILVAAGAERDGVTGIVTQKGESHAADIVVSAGDAHTALKELLEDQYTHKGLERYFSQMDTFSSLVFVALGVNLPLTDEPDALLLQFDPPLQLDSDSSVDDIQVRIHSYDPTLAPEGKTVVSAMLPTRTYKHWQWLKEQAPEKYAAEKRRIGDALIHRIALEIPGFEAAVEMVDVATPATFIDFTNNWKGSFEGWLMTPQTGMGNIALTLPDLEDFYMCGHWLAPGGGLPSALHTARDVAQLICHSDDRAFKVLPPEKKATSPEVMEVSNAS